MLYLINLKKDNETYSIINVRVFYINEIINTTMIFNAILYTNIIFDREYLCRKNFMSFLAKQNLLGQSSHNSHT